MKSPKHWSQIDPCQGPGCYFAEEESLDDAHSLMACIAVDFHTYHHTVLASTTYCLQLLLSTYTYVSLSQLMNVSVFLGLTRSHYQLRFAGTLSVSMTVHCTIVVIALTSPSLSASSLSMSMLIVSPYSKHKRYSTSFINLQSRMWRRCTVFGFKYWNTGAFFVTNQHSLHTEPNLHFDQALSIPQRTAQ